MKRILAISIALNVGFVVLAGLCWIKFSAHAAGGGGTPIGNGDVNGDGSYDISDAVYFLQWRFLGGPAPVAFQCPPPSGRGLPATGQTKCYDMAGFEIDCARPDFPGQDGFYRAGCPNEGRFVDNGDGTVTDTCTGLMWQQRTLDLNRDGSIGEEDRIPWQAALSYCENLELAGYTDWRLPNVRELQSLVDYGRSDPAIAPVFQVSSGAYWSSTSAVGDPGKAWGIVLKAGQLDVMVYGLGHPLSCRF